MTAAQQTEPLGRRTFDPVRRRSLPAGGEGRQRLSDHQLKLRLGALAKAMEDSWKPGQRKGGGTGNDAGGYSRDAYKVFRYLARWIVETGQAFPSYKEIAAEVRCTVRAAVYCVRQLADGGWLEWDRRFETTGRKGARGPQVMQTSNWYRLRLPNAAGALIERWSKRARPTESEAEEHDQAARAAFREACEEAERLDQLAAHEARSPAVARAEAKAKAERDAAAARARGAG